MSYIPEMPASVYEYFTDHIRITAGIHIPDNRRFFMETRLRKRLRELGIHDWIEYINLLNAPNTPENQHFVNAITSNKTHFFREREHFDFIETEVLPQFKGKSLSIWIGASSTGAEAYSLAILIDEFNKTNTPAIKYRILSTDIDTEANAKAEQGKYPALQVEEHVPGNLMQEYFYRGSGQNAGMYRVHDKLKQNIKFRYHNLLDPVQSLKMTFDLILVRNVFIYFQAETILKIVERVDQVLNPNCHLILGHCESIPDGSDYQNVGNSIYVRSKDRRKEGK
ncbi:MAG: protein-glutamate O-methyltransferase CheR [Zetaproteobacteria bacterium]|nr:protein-glutamate O-methyltransferase CheR [Zetaproteobacteria bacterium]